MVRDSNSEHQLLLPPANWRPIFASRTTQGGGHNSCAEALTFRSYGSATGDHLDSRTGERGTLASALQLGENVIAVQAWSPGGEGTPGGLYDTGYPDERAGAFDAGASPGQRQTGYAVGGKK